MITLSSAGEIFGLMVEGRAISLLICIMATDTGLSPSKGTWPVTISYMTIPREYRSDFPST